jgi:hypothetical protein
VRFITGEKRLQLPLANDATTGLLRYAVVDRPESSREVIGHNIWHLRLPTQER